MGFRLHGVQVVPQIIAIEAVEYDVMELEQGYNLFRWKFSFA